MPHVKSIFENLFGGRFQNFSEVTFELVSHEFDGLKNMYTLFSEISAINDFESGSNQALLNSLSDAIFQFGRMVGDLVLEAFSVHRKAQRTTVGTTPTSFSPRGVSSESKESPGSTSNEGNMRIQTPSVERGSLLSFSTPAPSTPASKHTPASSQKMKQINTRFTEDVVSMVDFLDNIVQYVFKGDTSAVKAAQRALKYIINFSSDDLNCIEVFASYCNSKINVSILVPSVVSSLITSMPWIGCCRRILFQTWRGS